MWHRRQLRKYKQWDVIRRQLIESVKFTFIKQLLNKEPILLEAIAKQSSIMQNNGRETIAVFVSEDTCKHILEQCVEPVESVDDIIQTFKTTGESLGSIGEVPVYLSSLMNRAPIFVVGEISWQLRDV
jgi:hypothetical protein